MLDHSALMLEAVAEAAAARGSTGDNPWVGCLIVDPNGAILARGHTQGPGEDHAEIVALRHCAAQKLSLAEVTLYSTLEPCSYHGRTPACSRAIVAAGVRRVVTGIRDPNPRVDGAGNRILRDAGIEVIEEVCATEVTRSLADWILQYYPGEAARSARAAHRATGSRDEAVRRLVELYGVDTARAETIVAGALDGERVGAG